QFQEFSTFAKGVQGVESADDTDSNWRAKIFWSTRSWKAHTTEQIPDERVAWTTVAGEVRQAGVVTFHRISDDRTKVMLQLELEPHGVTEQVGDKLGFVRRQAVGDLERFKSFIEKRGTETGGWRGQV
ncbi:cyclase, partial [Streptomyces sp. NRRL WC-3753]